MALVDAGDPPLLLLPGDADPQMPGDQSRELAEIYRRLGLDVELHILARARHQGDPFLSGQCLQRAPDFVEWVTAP